MKRTVIFGAGRTGQRILEEIKGEAEVVAFIDNDKTKWGDMIAEIPIIGNAESLSDLIYDEVLLGTLAGSDAMKKNLLDAGVPIEKINSNYILASVVARKCFIEDFATLCEPIDKSDLCIAEGGVFQGDFAGEINRVFPTIPFHLFDTFSGFDERDIAIEKLEGYSQQESGHFQITSEDIVLSKFTNPDMAIIHKGFFPETTKGLPEEKYLFVSLDFDLYQPTLEGLRYFVPKMVQGGCILVDDYFGVGYKGIKEAVKHFEQEYKVLKKGPIGDHSGIAIYI